MDWKEAEITVVQKYKDLQTSLNLYTPSDIDEHYDEAEFHRELAAIKEAYRGVDKGIRELMHNHGNSMPTYQREHWTR